MTDKPNQPNPAPDGLDPRHQQAFEIYWSLGQKRSYGRVARRIGVSASTIKLWSRQQRWQQRILEREVQQSRQLANRVASGPNPDSDRNLKIVRVAILKIAKAIAEGRVRSTMGDLDRMVRLEERLTGIHGINPKTLAEAAVLLEDVQHMTVDQLKAELARIAVDMGVVRKKDLVCPDDENGPPPGDSQGSKTPARGTIEDNREKSP